MPSYSSPCWCFWSYHLHTAHYSMLPKHLWFSKEIVFSATSMHLHIPIPLSGMSPHTLFSYITHLSLQLFHKPIFPEFTDILCSGFPTPVGAFMYYSTFHWCTNRIFLLQAKGNIFVYLFIKHLAEKLANY